MPKHPCMNAYIIHPRKLRTTFSNVGILYRAARPVNAIDSKSLATQPAPLTPEGLKHVFLEFESIFQQIHHVD